MLPKKEKRVYEKGQYIREHPELNVEEERKKARERLLRGRYGFGIRFSLPSWITEEDVLASLSRLALSDLLTISGKPVSRETLMRRCIKIAVAERRIDTEKLRKVVSNKFVSFYNGISINP